MSPLLSAISFAPVGNATISVICSITALLAAALCIRASGRRGIVRAVPALIAAVFLANPVLQRDLVQAVSEKALILVDGSASMALNGGAEAAPRAVAAIRARYPARQFSVRSFAPASADRTELAPALGPALDARTSAGISSIILVSDGQVHDAADINRLIPGGVPVNLLMVGDPATPDLRVAVHAQAPYTLVGKQARIEIVANGAARTGARIDVAWQVDGVAQQPLAVLHGQPFAVNVPVQRRGDVQVQFAIAPAPGERNLANNQALATLKGVRDRLKVLLVSGAPYPGVRLWRDTLKSDPAIDLVHFTILRTPMSLDYTPNSELALIPFPVEQLFNARLRGFDLVIFDSFGTIDLLDPSYFANVADYVRAGGGLLVIAGPEFGNSASLATTSLADLLPLRPQGREQVGAFAPARTPLGALHPLTAPLVPPWSAWSAHEPALATAGDTLLAGPGATPLLQIAQMARGRTAVLASNDLWLWSRSSPPGPWAELIRRLAHWLMQEPDLAFERLSAAVQGNTITVTGRGQQTSSGTVTLTDPTGKTTSQTLTPAGGLATAQFPAAAAGVYVAAAGGRRTALQVGTLGPEVQSVRPTLDLLGPFVQRSGGVAAAFARELPALAFATRTPQRIVGTTEQPLVPAWLALLLGLGSLVAVWLQERRS